MFWGLIMEPNKRYTQEVDKSFHVSQASLDIANSDAEPVQIMLTFEKRNYLLGTLQKGKVLQIPLDLNFDKGNLISFTSNGNSHVHLTGYLTPDDPYDDILNESGSDVEEEVPKLVPAKKAKRKNVEPEPSTSKKSRPADLQDLLNNTQGDSTSEDDEDYNPDDSAHDSDMEISGNALMDDELLDDDDDDDDDDDGNILDGDEDDDDDDDEDDDEEEDEDDDEEAAEEEKPKNGTKQKMKRPQQNGIAEQKDKKGKQIEKKDTKEVDAKQGKKVKKTLSGGVVVEDLKVGNGQVAQSGNKVQVYYVGRLKQNNKVFDSAQKGPGFKFGLGKGEVIKGWDVGVVGMKVGGKRRLTIPHSMAYGTKGSPPVIPPNSTLVFEIELRNVF